MNLLAHLKRRADRHAPWAYDAWYWARYLTLPDFRASQKAEVAAYRRLKAEVGQGFRARETPSGREPLIIFGFGKVATSVIERVIAAGFERAGFRPIMLASRAAWKTYRLLGLDDMASLGDFESAVDPDKLASLVEAVRTTDDLLNYREDGIQVGRYAASTLHRQLRVGSLDLTDRGVRDAMAACLRQSLAAADRAARILDAFTPQAVVMIDRGYTPYGEFFDTCMQRRIPVYTWNSAHRNGLAIFKRYGNHNRAEHFATLADETWARLRAMPWDEEKWRAIEKEFFDSYTQGEWFAEVGTQFHVRNVDREALFDRLGLDPAKKTVVVFAHIFWDATLFWGEDLFENYEEWLCEVLKVAARNEHLNWIVKVHPANVVKSRRDGIAGEASEVLAVRKTLGELPPHIKLLTAESDISTLSVFGIMDYCLTVRGTVGIESACRGIRVLTAGTGRYDRLGFTMDFDSRGAYLAQLENLQDVPPMSPQETELARRYAYGLFILRAVRLKSVRFRYRADEVATLEAQLSCRDYHELLSAPDVTALSEWIRSGTDDYLAWPDDEGVTV